MEYTARWGPKGFLVSPSKVVPFENFQTSVTLKSESVNDTSGTSATNTRGREVQPISFSTTYLRAAGVDPLAQIEEWESLVGSVYPLYIGGKRFGPAKMILKKVEVTDTLFSNIGVFLKAVVKITLEEYVDTSTTKSSSKTSSTTSSASKAAAVYAQTVAAKQAEKTKAINATASKTDKAALKPKATNYSAKAVAIK